MTLPRNQWLFSREFLDILPEHEMRRPKAMFDLAVTGAWSSRLRHKLTTLVLQVTARSNCYPKTVHVTARLLKCIFDQNRDRIAEGLTVRDIQLAKVVQFMVSMEPTMKSLNDGKLDSLRPLVSGGIAYVRGRCEKSIPKILGVDKLPILSRQT